MKGFGGGRVERGRSGWEGSVAPPESLEFMDSLSLSLSLSPSLSLSLSLSLSPSLPLSRSPSLPLSLSLSFWWIPAGQTLCESTRPLLPEEALYQIHRESLNTHRGEHRSGSAQGIGSFFAPWVPPCAAGSLWGHVMPIASQFCKHLGSSDRALQGGPVILGQVIHNEDHH